MKDVRQSYMLARRGTGSAVRRVSLPQLSRGPLGSNEEEQQVRWERVTIFLRLICLISGVGSIGAAWYLTRIGSSGVEDVPPPFILLAGLVGLGFLCISVLGRYPRLGSAKSIRNRE